MFFPFASHVHWILGNTSSSEVCAELDQCILSRITSGEGYGEGAVHLLVFE